MRLLPGGEALDVRGAPLGQGALAVVLLHGRDQDPAWMYDEVVSRVEAHGPLPSVTWAAPAASGRSWYAGRVHDLLTSTLAERDRAADVVDAVVATLAGYGHDPSTVVLAGFSQGACLVADHLLRRPRPWAGAVLWTGAAFGPPGTDWPAPPGPGPLAGMPALASNGDDDAWIGLASTGALAATLRAHGADVALRVVPGRGHEVGDEEARDTAALLARLAPH